MDTGSLRVDSKVFVLLFARTRQTAVALTADHTLRILSLPDGNELRTIDYGDRPVNAIDYSQDGAAVALGDRTGLVSVWDAATGQLRFDYRLPKYPGLLAFSPDGHRLAVTAEGDAAQILDAGNGKLVVTLGSQVGGTPALAFSPDGRWVATGDGDTVVRIHDAATGREVAQNREFLMVPLALAFTADNKSVLAVSGDRVVTIIDAATGATIRKLDRTSQPIWRLDVSPDGKFVAEISRKSEDITQPDRIVVRALDTWQTHTEWPPPTMPIATGWTGDGKLLVGLPVPEGVRLWRLH
ncbi:MAG: PQQ-binding-like beta-propeller repeat protein [Acidobacteria bacterium]|nr:PQQ-binding-like beta-propeller repeat protein [Acidobacteriota bacterium]